MSSSVRPSAGQRVEDRGPEAALGMVVFGQDQPSPGGRGGGREGGGVDRLDRVQVDDPGADPLAGQLVGRGQAFVQGHPGPDQGHLVVIGLAEHLGAADREGLRRVVQHRVGAPGGPHVRDAVEVGHGLCQRGGAGRVAGVQDGGAVDRAQHGQVLQRHLGRAVGADLDAGVRADQADVGLGDGRHPDEVVGAGEEGGEGGRERPVAARAEAHRGRHQLLLGDEHLEVALGIGLGELVGEGRVAHLAVHGHHVGTGTDRRQRVAVGLAGGYLLAEVVGRQLDLGRAVGAGRVARGRIIRYRAPDEQVTFAAELDDGAFGHLRRERLAVPAFLVFHLGEAAALERPGQDDRRLLPAEVSGLGQGPVDRGDVVPVDDERPGAERGHAATVGLGVPFVLGGAALAEPVDVDDGDQVGQLVVRGLVQGFPDGPLGYLAVAAQDPDPVRQFLQVLAGQRDADAVGQALAQRAGRHVDPGQHRGGMTFQPGAQPPVAGHQLLVRDDPDRLEDRVQQR